MAVTHVRPTARANAFRPEIRPISGLPLTSPLRPASIVVTADRRLGVGRPTLASPGDVMEMAMPAAMPTAGRHVATRAADDAAAAEVLLPTDAPLPTAALVKEAVDTALESLDALEHQARDVARRFRRGARAEAQLGLSQLMQSTRTLLELAAMAAGASGIELASLCERDDLHAEALTQMAVSELIRQQLDGNWTALATALDRPFAAALEGWRRVFIALGGTPTGPYGHAA